MGLLWGTVATADNWRYSGVLQILGVLRGTLRVLQVMWGTVGNYGVLQVLGVLGDTGGTGWCWGSKKSTVGYCMVLLGTTRYSVVLGCTRGHWLVLRVQDGSGGTVWYQRVLWRTIGYWGYWVVQGDTGKY